ncbi:hypothetical protein [Sorangium cellulosum]|uniref:hypothetical protein n=1 Tax=Sorangium TaxID=39643 RepID=UPI001F1C06A3|nr:hypothetical protein [Sorangium cellulosum]
MLRTTSSRCDPASFTYALFCLEASRLARNGRDWATSRYVEWVVLMKRSFGFDALRCPRCERRMRVLSTITDSAVVRRILDHLNLPSQPRTAAPARDPTWEPMAFGFDAA